MYKWWTDNQHNGTETTRIRAKMELVAHLPYPLAITEPTQDGNTLTFRPIEKYADKYPEQIENPPYLERLDNA